MSPRFAAVAFASFALLALPAGCSSSVDDGLSRSDGGSRSSQGADGAIGQGGGGDDGGGASSSGDGGGSSGGGSSGGGATGSGAASDGGVTSGGLTLITEPAQGVAPIEALIRSATKRIDMTMYELTDTTVTSLLTQAAGSGVTVRVILDQNLEKSSNTKAYNALTAGKVQVHWADATYAATHQKTITVDGATSAIMTLNLTPEYYATSRDFALVTSNVADVAAIEATFAADFASSAITPVTGDDLVWSPTNARTAMTALISNAQKTLVVENEEMSDSGIVSALEAAASRGVGVEVVMTASTSWDTELTALKSAGVKVSTYAANASLYIHAKIILADLGESGATLFLGSENFSSASLGKNRELGILLTDPAIQSAVGATLASDFAGATPY